MDNTTKFQLVLVLIIFIIGIMLLLGDGFVLGCFLVSVSSISFYTEILPSIKNKKKGEDIE